MYKKVFKNIQKLQTKVVLSMILMVFCMGVIVSIFGTLVTRFSTTDALETTLTETTKLAAISAEKSIHVHQELIEYIACQDILTSETATWEEKHAFLRQCAEDLEYLDAYIFDPTGVDHISGYNVASIDYFTHSMKGETYVSTPYPKYTGDGMYIVVSTPVYTNGTISSVICLSIDQMVFQEIVENIVVGQSENKATYILDKNGTTIASLDYESVLAMKNTVNGTAEDAEPAPAALIEIESKMISGASGIATWEHNGITYLQAYAPIANSDNWSIAVTIELAEFMETSQKATFLLIGIVIALLILCSFFALYIGKSIAAPITSCSARLQLLAEGDLHSPVPDIDGRDEVAALAQSTGALISSFTDIIEEMDTVLSGIANGNLSNHISTEDYPGDFASLKKNLRIIDQQLNRTIGNISVSAEQVYNGSRQVSDGAQSLAQGATEQASSIEELSATVSEISDRIKRTANNADVANQTSGDAESKLLGCNSHMEHLVSAMNDINSKSEEISKIIKVIEDISFQTNILALNAAVEAARAGAAGKGFAVVADEVRNLAAKSAEASKNTSALIESSVSSVQNGMKILRQTEDALEEVVVSARRSTELVNEISSDATEQASAISQITSAIDQIAAVIHMTSATSEESAATSDSLSKEAQLLKNAVDQFQLKDQLHNNYF